MGDPSHDLEHIIYLTRVKPINKMKCNWNCIDKSMSFVVLQVVQFGVKLKSSLLLRLIPPQKCQLALHAIAVYQTA